MSYDAVDRQVSKVGLFTSAPRLTDLFAVQYFNFVENRYQSVVIWILRISELVMARHAKG